VDDTVNDAWSDGGLERVFCKMHVLCVWRRLRGAGGRCVSVSVLLLLLLLLLLL